MPASVMPASPRQTSPALPAAAQPPAATPALVASGADTPTAAAPAYGAEIGSASSIKALRTRWASIHSAHAQVLEGLRPVVSLRDNPQSNHIELRLVVGPLASADAAGRLCALLATFHVACQPTMFDDRQVALE